MLLRSLDAFGKNDRYVKEFSIIAAVGGTAPAAAISTAFACSKGSGSGEGDLPIDDASFIVGWLSVRSGQSVANADNGSGMPSYDGVGCACLRGLFALVVHRS
jgi:hypothetical protein